MPFVCLSLHSSRIRKQQASSAEGVHFTVTYFAGSYQKARASKYNDTRPDPLSEAPEYTFSLAISHRIQNGPLKGLSFGANGSLQLDCPLFYATQLNGSRILYKRSDIFNHGAYIGYEFKLGRNLRLRSQLHCSNLFDTQKIDIRPAAAGGAPRLAAPLYTPRLITWSNTLSF